MSGGRRFRKFHRARALHPSPPPERKSAPLMFRRSTPLMKDVDRNTAPIQIG
jgi:hypothetical protein